jgi:hypothetical protein
VTIPYDANDLREEQVILPAPAAAVLRRMMALMSPLVALKTPSASTS